MAGQNPFVALIAKFRGAPAVPALGLLGVQSDLLTSELHGRKYDQAYQKKSFFGANQSGVTTSAALATTYVGLCLSNPAGSGVNLEIRNISAVIDVAVAAELMLNLITGFVSGGITVHTTAVTPQASLVGNTTTALAKLDAACTLVGTPLWSRPLAVTSTATGFAAASAEIDGGLVLIPGSYCAIGTSAAGPTSGFWGSFEWTENPV